MPKDYMYAPQEYKKILSDFLSESEWLIKIDVEFFFRNILEELFKSDTRDDYFRSFLTALEMAEIIEMDPNIDADNGVWESFIDKNGAQTFISSPEDIAAFKRKIIQQYGRKDRIAISDDLRKKIFTRDGYRCKICESILNLVVDHIYPHSLGGADSEDNLQTLCRSCNSRKGAKVSNALD